MTLWLFLIGLITLLGQVVLLREILVASFGSELIYLLAMGVQMLGTASGAVAGRYLDCGRLARPTRRASSPTGFVRFIANRRPRRPPGWTGETPAVHGPAVQALFIAFAAALPLLVALARAERVLFRGTPGAYLPFHQQLAGIALVLLPIGMLGGMLFTVAARTYVGNSRTLAAAYAVESLGGLAGGALSTGMIAFGVQNLAAAILCGIIAAAAALVGARRWMAGAGAAVVLLLVAALVSSPQIDRRLTALDHPRLLASRDTPYGRATVTGSLGQFVVFVNDALAFESQGTSAEEFVHLAALQVERPRSVLVIGGAVEGVVREVRKHGPTRVRDVEVDERLVSLARSFLPRNVHEALDAPGVLTIDEPRRFLDRADRYDLILSAMPEPDSGQASRFYTREFFESCARPLTPGGVVAFRLRSSENLWTPALTLRTASIVNALRSSFADVVVLPGAVNVVIASNRPLERNPEVLAARFRERGIEARLVSPAYIRYVYTNDRLAEIERALAVTHAPESRDTRPVCYQYTLLLWLSRFFPALATFAPAEREATAVWIVAAVLLIAVVGVARRSPAMRRTLLVGFSGFAGLVLEGSLILSYQIRHGVLYQDLGILLATFMFGLAAGSWALGRRAAAAHLTAATGVTVLIATAAVACVTAWGVSSPGRGLLSCALFLFAAGLTTGAIFGYASLRQVEEQSAAVAPLYAADLLGGVAGSIAATLFLVPFAGLTVSILLIGALAVVVLPLV